MNLIEYSLVVFFFFYLANHAEYFAGRLENLFAEYGDSINHFFNYITSCAFCSTFWISLVLWAFSQISIVFLFAAPPIVMFLNLIFVNFTKSENNS